MAKTCNEVTYVGIWFPSWTHSCWMTQPKIERAELTLLHLLRVVVIPLLRHTLAYLIFSLLFILLQCFTLLIILLWQSLLYWLYQLFYCIIFYFIRDISCPAVVSFVILYYKSCSAVVSFVVFIVIVILL